MDSLACLWVVGICLFPVSPPRHGSAPSSGRLQRYEFAQISMGVSFNLTLYASNEATANKAASAALARIEQLDHILSDYRPDSELVRLCQMSGPGKPTAVSHELLFVLKHAATLSQRTDGAFDVTVAPLVKLWRRARRRKQLPDPNRLAEAKNVVGHRFVRIDDRAATVELLKPGVRLDFGGIAKGYAADEALRVLKEHGITRALIDASGDIVAGEPPPGKPGWRIGIAPLTGANAAPSRFLQLRNASVATSGDAFQYVEIDGTRYSHIIDPRTGMALTRRSSVTVIAPDGITADSLASAVSVLGPVQGRQLIESTRDTATLIVVVRGDCVETFTSRGFEEREEPEAVQGLESRVQGRAQSASVSAF